MFGRAITMAFMLAILAPAALAAANPLSPTAAALRVAPHTVTLDGRLDEPAWKNAQLITLTQQDPHPGAPTPYRTEVRVLIDAQHIYFGFTNIDPHPDQIAVHTLQRDNDQGNDDHI
ncbi:MAG TPA: hypothetical protein VFL54_08755, partial [Gammaproteobacteria bacterium]|nr:hypothetical protein [Gammaproteobacteria bacterium]